MGRTITHHRAGRDHPGGPARRADASSSRTCSTGVRDRVVIAVTFLAMLELMKRREIVVEQAAPWGPIVARATTADGAGRRRGRRTLATSRSTSRWSRSRDDAPRPGRARPSVRADAGDDPPPDGGRRRPPPPTAEAPAPIELTEAALEALLFVAEKPLSRREIATLAGTDRATVDARLGDLEVSLRERGIRLLIDGDRVELATAPEGGALVARYVGADAVRLSPASLETLAIVAYRQPVTKSAVERIRGVDSDYTIRTLLHRRFIVELGRSEAPGRPFLYGTGFEFLERFGLTSLDELPPLDADVAARLAEEGGEPITRAALPVEPADDGRRRGRQLMALERLQKVLAASGVASRRASEVLIANGRVTVDGKPAKLGMQVDPDTAIIAVDGRVIGAAAAPEYLLLHKPAGVTSTVRDRHASKTVLDMIPTALLPEGGRLYPVGRLDQDSEGLLVLTNDGAWADRVLHPRHGIEREYAIGLRAPLTGEQVAAIKAGIALEEGLATLTGLRATTEIETRRLVELLAPPPAPSSIWYRAILAQGWKRQLRRMFGAVGAPIERLVRVRIGPVRLDDLPSGRARRLRAPEVRGLGAGAGTSRAGATRTRPAAAKPTSTDVRRR